MERNKISFPLRVWLGWGNVLLCLHPCTHVLSVTPRFPNNYQSQLNHIQAHLCLELNLWFSEKQDMNTKRKYFGTLFRGKQQQVSSKLIYM